MQKNSNKGNMYEFITHTSNPVKGLCSHQCSYCYMTPIYQKSGANTQLRLDEKELACNYGSGNTIFIGSSTDQWAADVPTEWLLKVYDHCAAYPENYYLLQSKNPGRFLEEPLVNHPLMLNMKDRLVLATTLETNRDDVVLSNAPKMSERAVAMAELSKMGYRTMITMEPIVKFDLEQMVDMIKAIGPVQVNIGCNSRSDIQLDEPSADEIMDLANAISGITTVEFKKNMKRIFGMQSGEF